MTQIKKSILVLGSVGHNGATKCIEWGEELVYVGDYDYLVVNTTSLNQAVLRSILSVDSGYFNKIRKDIIDVQQNIGIPISCILGPYVFDEDVSYSRKNIEDILKETDNNYSWSPVIPKLEKIPTGKKLDMSKSDLPRNYLQKIDGYNILYDGCVNVTGFVDANDKGFYTKFYKRSLLRNPVGRDVGFSLCWKFCKHHDNNILIDGNNPIQFVPPTSDVKEGINILINEFQKGSEDVVPEWVSGIVLPREKEVGEEINNKLKTIDSINQEVEILSNQLVEIDSYKKLLYSTGHSLEDVVDQSLNLLGIIVDKPTVSNTEDRFFNTPDDTKIYFEIRGVSRLMNEGDITQLIKRVIDQPVSANYKTRGVFVFNHQNNLKPADRGNAFNHNIEEQAKGFGLCLIDGPTLFNLVKKKLSGDSIVDFEQELFNTIGVFEAKS